MLKEQLPPSEDEITPVGRDSKFGDRILIWCFIASILVNLGFGFWLNYADLYGTKRVAQEQKQMKLQVYKPPVKQKPKPKPKPKPKIPPKPVKIIPKIVHEQPRPRPTPPRAAPPTHFTVGHHSTSKTAIAVEPPSEPTPTIAAPVAPENTTVQPAPPSPPAAIPAPKPTPPAPVYVPPPAPVHHAPPPPPPPPPKPKGYVDVESREASIDDSSIPQVDTQGLGIDPNTITGPCVVTFTISTTGRISNVRVKKSSGSSDYDDACVKVTRQGHGTPGVQDHILHEAQGQYTFNVG